MCSLLLLLVMQTAGPAVQSPTVEIVVPASAATVTLQHRIEVDPKGKPKPGFESSSRTGLEVKSLLDFLRPLELSRIVVERYPEVGVTESALKSQLQYVLTARMEGMFSQVVWAEFHTWDIAATLMFKDGTRGKIFMDGGHGCYEDPEGYRWFFRYQRKPTDG